jgi:tRNA(Ile)-lysidine synthase
MAPLGPFEPRPRLAVAVSGGADSLALALLADHWARGVGGDARALIVDHGLRPAAAAEAALTRDRLAGRGIAAEVIGLAGLGHGPGLAARARAARYAALEAACRDAGRLHLLLGHHAADQAETLAMRMLAGSGAAGRAAMPALTETAGVRLLRPLLGVAPMRLRATLAAARLDWVEDPSNADPAAQRARLRRLRRDRDGHGPATRAAVAAAAASGRERTQSERLLAAELARRASLYPEGYALLRPGKLPAPALAALLRAVGGAAWAPAPARVEQLAGALRAATLGGVRLLPAGRLSAGAWLIVREADAMAPPVAARPGAVWDNRFRLLNADGLPPDTVLGATGDAAAGLRRRSGLPAAVLRTLPALWRGGALVAVPYLCYTAASGTRGPTVLFAPPSPVACAAFAPAASVLPS